MENRTTDTLETGSDEALTKALKDMEDHGASMDEFPEAEILAADNGSEWTSSDGKFKLIKHGPESYNAQF